MARGADHRPTFLPDDFMRHRTLYCASLSAQAGTRTAGNVSDRGHRRENDNAIHSIDAARVALVAKQRVHSKQQAADTAPGATVRESTMPRDAFARLRPTGSVGMARCTLLFAGSLLLIALGNRALAGGAEPTALSRFEVQAQLGAAPAEKSNGRFSLRATLTRSAPRPDSGARFLLSATLHGTAKGAVCPAPGTVFANGFEAP